LSVQVLDAVFSFFLIKVEDDLGIGARGELMSPTEQLLPEFQVVEDLAIERNPQGTVLVGHGLVAAGEIDDAEAGVRQTYAILRMKSSIVRSAMRQHPDHPPKGFGSDGSPIKIVQPCNTAHNDLTP